MNISKPAYFLILLFPVSAFCQRATLKVRVVQQENFDSLSALKMDSAVAILESTFNSASFQKQLSSVNFEVGNKGMNNEEIVRMILSGQNEVGKAPDSCIDLRLSLYDKYAGGKEMGKTNMQLRLTSTHRCFVQNNSAKCYASHLAHEYMHQIGFRDKKSKVTFLKRTKTNSVPYKVGRLVNKFIQNGNDCFAQQERTCIRKKQ